MQTPFEIIEPQNDAVGERPNFVIHRQFPLLLTPDQLMDVGLTPEDLELDDSGALDGEHEIELFVDTSYRPSRFAGSLEQPPDPDEFEVYDWSPVSVDGIKLSSENSDRLKAYVSHLTRDEENELFRAARAHH